MNLAIQDIVQYSHQLLQMSAKSSIKTRNLFYYDYAEIC